MLCEILYVIVNYGLSVDLCNNKGYFVYLLVLKMFCMECVRILKVEVRVLVGVWDLEFFLSDEEWIKKVNKNFKKEKVKFIVCDMCLKIFFGVS